MVRLPLNSGEVRCSSCGRVRFSPQRICIACFVETNGWVQVSTEGVLVANTWVLKPSLHDASVDPLMNGVIGNDGVNDNMIHPVHTGDLGALAD
jgi:uncharacterized OB-fold protein